MHSIKVHKKYSNGHAYYFLRCRYYNGFKYDYYFISQQILISYYKYGMNFNIICSNFLCSS